MRQYSLARVITALAIVACRTNTDDTGGNVGGSDSTNIPAGVAVSDTATLPAGTLPLIGLAVSDSAGGWCAEFASTAAADSAQSGRVAKIVFGKPDAVVSLTARVGSRREGECGAAFPQPRWADYVAYDVALIDSFPPGATERPIVALIVLGSTAWSRNAGGNAHADIDRDGSAEELRRCTADEGEHFTVWSTDSTGTRVRRWHEYYDWGGLTDPTCGPGENGR